MNDQPWCLGVKPNGDRIQLMVWTNTKSKCSSKGTMRNEKNALAFSDNIVEQHTWESLIANEPRGNVQGSLISSLSKIRQIPTMSGTQEGTITVK